MENIIKPERNTIELNTSIKRGNKIQKRSALRKAQHPRPISKIAKETSFQLSTINIF